MRRKSFAASWQQIVMLYNTLPTCCATISFLYSISYCKLATYCTTKPSNGNWSLPVSCSPSLGSFYEFIEFIRYFSDTIFAFDWQRCSLTLHTHTELFKYYIHFWPSLRISITIYNSCRELPPYNTPSTYPASGSHHSEEHTYMLTILPGRAEHHKEGSFFYIL